MQGDLRQKILALLGGPEPSLRAGNADMDRQAILDALAMSAGLPQVQSVNRASTLTSSTQISDGIITNAKLALSQALFDKMDQATAAAWITQAPLVIETIGGTGGAVRDDGYGVIVSSTVTDGFLAGSLLASSVALTAIGADLAAGTIVEIVAVIKATGFATEGAGNLMGIGLSANPTMTADAIKTGNTQRIAVGVDAAGDIFVVCGSGAGVTATDTTVNAVSGTAFKVKIHWTVGTSVVVTIDANAPTTIATTLPVRLNQWFVGGASLGAVATRDVRFYGGAIRITSAP